MKEKKKNSVKASISNTAQAVSASAEDIEFNKFVEHLNDIVGEKTVSLNPPLRVNGSWIWLIDNDHFLANTNEGLALFVYRPNGRARMITHIYNVVVLAKRLEHIASLNRFQRFWHYWA